MKKKKLKKSCQVVSQPVGSTPRSLRDRTSHMPLVRMVCDRRAAALHYEVGDIPNSGSRPTLKSLLE